jgi:hypothetical protein
MQPNNHPYHSKDPLRWPILLAAIFYRAGARVVGVMAIAVFSHWTLDAFVHFQTCLIGQVLLSICEGAISLAEPAAGLTHSQLLRLTILL